MALSRCLSRYLAHAVLVLALAAGCSQSLFINPGGDGDGDGDGGVDRPDAREAPPPPPDGSMMLVDGGEPGDVDGGGGGSPDAGTHPECPEPCAGDAFAEFTTLQGGRTGQWRYVEIVPEAVETPFVDMDFEVLPDNVVAWVGTGTEAPSIAICSANRPNPPCFELFGWLAFTSPGNEPDAHQPALRWTVERAGFYRVSGYLLVSSQAPQAATRWQVSKNGLTEIILTDSTLLTTEPYMFMSDVELQAGDTLVLTLDGTSAESVSVGLRFFITGPLTP